MSVSVSRGTTFKIGTQTIGKLTSIGGVSISRDTQELAPLDSTTGYKEYIPDWKDGGEVSLEGYLDGTDAGQSAILTALESDAESDCSIVFPAAIGKTWSFKGVVTAYSTSAGDGMITFSATVKVSGKPTLAASQN